MLVPDYPLRTERLLIRPFTLDDLDAMTDLYSRPDVVRYLYQDVWDRETARQKLVERQDWTRLDDQHSNLLLAVEHPGTGALLGDVLLEWRSRDHAQGEVGYVLHPDHAGHGFATEAAREMLRLGFDELGLHRIVGRADARNAGSVRVLERLGMRREALLRENEFVKGEWCDEAVLAMLRREWDAQDR